MGIENSNRWHVVKQAMTKVAGGTFAAMLAGAMMIGAPGCALGASQNSANSGAEISKAVQDEESNASGTMSEEVGSSGSASSQTTPASLSSGVSSVREIDESLYDMDYSDRDLNSSYDESTAVKIELSDTTAAIEGTGATADGSKVTISEAGVYLVSGTLSDGQIVVDAADDAKVQIVLDGVDITNSDGSALYVKHADKCFVTLADGSKNMIADGSSYADGDDASTPDAAIYSECDLTLQGSGSLTVDAQYNDGIKSKDDLVITGGTYSVTAKVDAIVGNDSVKIANGAVKVKTTEGDGIKSSKDDDESKGFVIIDGGSIEVDAGDKGIKSETYLRIADDVELEVKAADDALHTNGSARINGGAISLVSGDDGVHAEYVLDLNGGTLDIAECTEGLEGQVININDGTASIVSSDDAVNAASPENTESSSDSAETYSTQSEQSTGEADNVDNARKSRGDLGGFGGRGGSMMETDENCAININGGTLTIEAEGDGLDSNGYINLAGGVVYISGPTNSGNGSIDTGIGAKVTGGTLIAAGTTGMAESFSEGTQGFALIPASGKAGSKISVLDESGNELASYTPTKDFQCVVVTTPAMKAGTSYELSVDGTKTAFEATNTGNTGMGMGGQKFGDQRPDSNQSEGQEGPRPERHGKPGDHGGMRQGGEPSNQSTSEETLA